MPKWNGSIIQVLSSSSTNMHELDPTIQPHFSFLHLLSSQMKCLCRISEVRYSSWSTKHIPNKNPSLRLTSHPSSSSIPHIVPTTLRNPQSCKAEARWTTSSGVSTTSPPALWQAERNANSASWNYAGINLTSSRRLLSCSRKDEWNGWSLRWPWHAKCAQEWVRRPDRTVSWFASWPSRTRMSA